MNYLKKTKIEAKAFLVKGKMEMSTCGMENMEIEQLHIAKNESNALTSVDHVNWGSDQLCVSDMEEVDFYISENILNKIKESYNKQINVSKFIKKEFMEDTQFIRYFRDLFSNLYEEMKGIQIYVDDVFDKNNGNSVLYESIPNSRLEFLMYLKSVTEYMINEEKQEAEEQNISLN